MLFKEFGINAVDCDISGCERVLCSLQSNNAHTVNDPISTTSRLPPPSCVHINCTAMCAKYTCSWKMCGNVRIFITPTTQALLLSDCLCLRVCVINCIIMPEMAFAYIMCSYPHSRILYNYIMNWIKQLHHKTDITCLYFTEHHRDKFDILNIPRIYTVSAR